MKTADISVEYIQHTGSDLAVANAARVSFDKESAWEWFDRDGRGPVDSPSPCGKYFNIQKLLEKDAGLIKYLAKHKHFSPFNHSFITLRIKAPVFVARQLVKHRFMPWNEVSRRYVDDEVEVYLPEFWRGKAENVKQGSSEEEVKVNTYGTGVCIRCGADVPRKSAGPRGKWCSEKCRASHRKEHDPDFRLHTAKYNAQKRGISYELVRGDVQWVDKCPILGIDLDYNSTESDGDNSPSLDRIDSDKGYTRDNVWVISNKANRMKNDASREELILFAKKVLLHFSGQTVPDSSSIEDHIAHCVKEYERLLKIGVCAEQARMILPQNMMTSWWWSGTLGAYCDMLKLRLDPHTQKESRIVAEKVKAIIEPLFPVSVPALLEAK